MGLKVVRVDPGVPHPRTIWSHYIVPGGVSEAELRRQAEGVVATYNRENVDKPWFNRNACKVGKVLDRPLLGVIWEEFEENEFGLEIP